MAANNDPHRWRGRARAHLARYRSGVVRSVVRSVPGLQNALWYGHRGASRRAREAPEHLRRHACPGPAHSSVIAGLRAGVLPEASRRGIVGLDVVSRRKISPGPLIYLRAGAGEQRRSNRCSCPS
jgi:hypothetical protein